jgi:putative transposase
MARQPRLIIPGVAVHIVQRRVDRSACFREDTDRMVYLAALRELLKKTQCAFHAYCLMTNHVHLLLTPPDEAACGTLMRDLGRKYVRYFNDRYGRQGTLWEGRFHSCLVDSREYVLDCYRYVELNPVRAAMVQQALAYPWSSHRANATGVDDPSLTPHAEYEALGAERAARRAAYSAFCSAEEQADFLAVIREATHGGYPLVAPSLKEQLRGKGCRVERGKPGPRAKESEQTTTGELEL